jgi:choline monooxygenase
MNIENIINEFQSSLPIEEAFCPPSSWYTNQEFYEAEKQLLLNEWQFVGASSKLVEAGDYFTGKFLNKPYIVVRDENKKLKAFLNICSHHGTCVARGTGNTKKFVCPYHGWTYNLSGEFKYRKQMGEIRNLEQRNLNLKEIPCDEFGPLVALNFNMQTTSEPPSKRFASLLTRLNDSGWGELEHVKTITYTIPCNWKVFVDNYLDGGYHVPHMHKGLTGQLDVQSYHSEVYEDYSVQTCGVAKKEKKVEGVDFQERLSSAPIYAWMFPNFMINRYGDWVDTNLVIPRSTGECDVVFEYFVSKDKAQDKDFLDKSFVASDKVQEEDIEVCKMVQDGLDSGSYNQGIYAPAFEKPMYQFHQKLSEQLKQL